MTCTRKLRAFAAMRKTLFKAQASKTADSGPKPSAALCLKRLQRRTRIVQTR